MSFGKKSPFIKTPKEKFAEAVAKYREVEAALKQSVAGLQNDIQMLTAQKAALTIEVSALGVSVADLNHQLAEAKRLLAQKQSEHLVWVADQLGAEKAKLDTATSNYALKQVELEDEKLHLVSARNGFEAKTAVLSAKLEQLAAEKRALEAEREVARQNASDDRAQYKALIDQQRDLNQILEAREKASRPEPKPITLAQQRRRKNGK